MPQAKIPQKTVKSICLDDTKAALADIIIPYEQAQNGDIVALIRPLELTSGSVGTFVLPTLFVVKDEDGYRDLTYREILEMGHPQAPNARHAKLLLDDDHMACIIEIDRGVRPSDPSSNAFIGFAYFLPGFIFIISDDPQGALEAKTSFQDFDQGMLEGIALLISKEEATSHEKIASVARRNSAISIINDLVNLYDQEGDAILLEI